MPASLEQLDDIEHRFTHHPPGSPAVANTHQDIRLAMCQAAVVVADRTERCREQSLALTALEEAMFWANAAVARHHPDNRPAKEA